MRRRSFSIGLAALAVASVLGGCSGSESSSTRPSPSQTPATSPSPTTSDPGAQGSFDDVTLEDFVKVVREGEGSSGRVTVTQTETNIEATGVVTYNDLFDISVELVVPPSGKDTFEVTQVGGKLYARRLGSASGFVVLEPNGDESLYFRQVTDFLNPRWAVVGGAESVERIRYIGKEIPDGAGGETVDHYLVEQDTRTALKNTAHPFDQFKGVPTKMSTDYWFARNGNVRRIELDLGSLGLTTVKFSDWGGVPPVQKPPV